MKRFLTFFIAIFSAWSLSAQSDSVTFQVDMSNYAGSFGTVYVSGGFNSWGGGNNPLTDQGNGIWSAKIGMPANTDSMEYKFQLDQWAQQENFDPTTADSACTITDPTGQFTNRLIIISGDTILPVVCYDNCGACDPALAPKKVTFQVDMSQYGASFGTAYVSGGFNSWGGGNNPLTDQGNGIWSAEVLIGPMMDSIEYKFQVDQWAYQEDFDPSTDDSVCTITAGGFTNRLAVITGDTILPVVCYDKCDPCAAASTYNITFAVSLANVTTDPNNVYVAGGSGFGVPGDNPMVDPDGNDVWTTTLSRPAGFSSHYTFINGPNSWNDKENLAGQPCADPGNFNDRWLPPVNSDTVIYTCFGECTNDSICSPPVTDSVNVTFVVSASEIMTDPTGLFIAGGGTFGNPGDNPMDDSDGNDVWKFTIRLPEGAASHYTFTNGSANGWGDKENIAGQACADPGAFNDRFFPGAFSDTSIYTCFGECTDDTICSPPLVVTFQIDSRGTVVDSAGWKLAGNFEGWGASIDLADADGDSIYSVEVNMFGNAAYEYKFVNGSAFEDFDPATADSACTLTTGNFTNRILNLGSTDTVLCAPTYGECCQAVSIDELIIDNNIFSLKPVPTSDFAFISFANTTSEKQVRVMNLTGQVLFTQTATDDQIKIDVNNWASGLYFVQVQIGNKVGSRKLVVE